LILVFIVLAISNPTKTDFVNEAQDRVALATFNKTWKDLDILARGGISLVLNATVRRDDYVIFSLYTFDLGLLSFIDPDAKQKKFVGILGMFFSTELLGSLSSTDVQQKIDNARRAFWGLISDLESKITPTERITDVQQKIDVSKLVGRYWHDLVDPSKNTPLSEQFKSSVVRRLPMGGRVQDAFDRFTVTGPFQQYTNQSVVVSRCLRHDCPFSYMHVAISNNGAIGIIIHEDDDCFLYRTSDYSDWKTLSDARANEWLKCDRYLSDTIID